MGKTSSSGGFPWNRGSKQPSYRSPFDQDDQVSFDSSDDSLLELDSEIKPGSASQLNNPTERWSQAEGTPLHEPQASETPYYAAASTSKDSSYDNDDDYDFDDSDDEEDGDVDGENSEQPALYAYQGSPLAIILAQREKKHLVHLMAITIVMVLLADAIFTLVRVQQPRWLFGNLSDNGVTEFQHHPNLVVFGIYLLALTLSIVSFFMAVHIKWRSKHHGSTLRSFAIWTRRFCAVTALSCAIMVGAGGPAFFDQLGQGTLPLLPTNSRVLGSEYKTIEGWLAEGNHKRELKAAFEAPNERIIADIRAEGFNLSVHISAPDNSYEELKPAIEQVSRRAMEELNAYGVSNCQVSIQGVAKNAQLLPDLTLTKDQLMPGNLA
ncbi:hypothetical protein KIMH_11950 [Bombiscardovia apis]|uniref:Alkaline shock response membrane anchor protein AmaP n=1 Tax=Bombiscardovia apis TaxID=2932182 RepID=A0ABN6SGG0_9BIFI|nr:hypothetical protein [Bombiscardovia apis]BDR55084.1 hypothetical protein KIMH_11950 [Bombiscardovia apis]